MKKLYDYRMLISKDNGKSWNDTSWYHHIVYMDEKNSQNKISKELSFNELFELVKEGEVMNSQCWKTFFKKRKRISLSLNDGNTVLKEGTNKKIIIKKVFVPYNASLSELYDQLDSEDFIEYLKDRNISFN